MPCLPRHLVRFPPTYVLLHAGGRAMQRGATSSHKSIIREWVVRDIDRDADDELTNWRIGLSQGHSLDLHTSLKLSTVV